MEDHYGDEWEKQVMSLTKKLIVELFKTACKAVDAMLEEAEERQEVLNEKRNGL